MDLTMEGGDVGMRVWQRVCRLLHMIRCQQGVKDRGPMQLRTGWLKQQQEGSCF